MGNYTLLRRFRLVIKRKRTTAETRQLEKQMVDFVDEFFSKEQRTKDWMKMSEISGKVSFLLWV
jgi:hypothetical protein